MASSFVVLENDVPADVVHFKNIHHTWDKSVYEKFKDALSYALEWIGPYCYRVPKSWKGEPIKIAEGVVIQIKKVK